MIVLVLLPRRRSSQFLAHEGRRNVFFFQINVCFLVTIFVPFITRTIFQELVASGHLSLDL
jgi:hypothetical protein